jgi:hypothetical protein
MKQTERKRLLNRSRPQLVDEIDELRDTVKRWKDQYQPSEVTEPAPFYWMIGYYGWGSEEECDFIDGGDSNPTAQAAVDTWETMHQNNEVKAYDQDHNDPSRATLLVYRIDEVGRAMTDRRWVFKAQEVSGLTPGGSCRV